MNSLPLHLYDALLFDLDGTLADSMELHNRAWIATLEAKGLKITRETLLEFAGVPNPVTLEIFNKRFGWSLDPVATALEKDNLFFDSLHLVQPIAPVVNIARQFEGQKPMAIVSGGTKKMVSRILTALQLHDLFTVRVCEGDAPRAKPHPDPFLRAAELLNVAPEKCVVFEDGAAGIQGAQAAGMAVVRVNAQFELNLLD